MNKNPKESSLQKAIIDHLNKIGFLAWRNNTGAFGGEYKGKKWYVKFGIPGSADIFAIVEKGRFLGIEVKRKGRLPSPQQNAWMQMIREAGGIAIWVDNWDSYVTFSSLMKWPI